MSLENWTYCPDWFVPEVLIPFIADDNEVTYRPCSFKTLTDVALSQLKPGECPSVIQSSIQTATAVSTEKTPIQMTHTPIHEGLKLADAPVYIRGFISRRRACSKKLLFWDLVDAASPCQLVVPVGASSDVASISSPVCLECVVKYPLITLERVKAMTKQICMFTFVELTCYLELNSKGELSLLVIDAAALRDNTHPSWPLHHGHTAYAATHTKTQTLPDDVLTLRRPDDFPFIKVPPEACAALQKRLSALQRLASDPTAYTNFTRAHGRCGVTAPPKTNASESAALTADAAAPATSPVCLGWLRDKCKRPNCPLRHCFLDAEEEDKFRVRKRRREHNIELESDAHDPFASEGEGGKLNKTQRACVFVDWVLRALPHVTGGVVDVAGGRGDVSFALMARGVSSTVVDPRPVKLSRKQHDLVRETQQRIESAGADCAESAECVEDCCVTADVEEGNGQTDPLYALPPQFQQEFHFHDVVRGREHPESADAMIQYVLNAQLLLGKPTTRVT